MIRRLALYLLGLSDMESRMKDVERHFVTKRNPETGQVIETLADVPIGERKDRKEKLKGMSVNQRRQWLEATDGGRLIT